MTREEEIPLDDAYCEARERVLTTPAETISDLRAKAEIIWTDTASTPSPEMILAAMRDLHGLTDHEPSRYFDAAEWLAWFEKLGRRLV